MQIVIDVENSVYEAIKNVQDVLGHIAEGNTLLQRLIRAVQNGTPIPKGHGNLVDVDELLSNEKPVGISDELWEESHTYKMLTNALIIIEADKRESEDT